MTGRQYPPEVRFTIEIRQPTGAQTEAGEKFFGKLTAKACASLMGRSAPNEGSEESEEQDVGEGKRWDSS
jgi:hypothetical protein